MPSKKMKSLLFVVELFLIINTNADPTSANNVISSHVLDISCGKPAASVRIVAYTLNNTHQWTPIGSTVTDSNGRVAIVHPGYDLKNGHYLLHFYTASYFSNRGMDTFYPYVEVVFEVRNSSQHYHVPITLSNYGYSTYRGQ